MREEVDKCSRDILQEFRLRIGQAPTLVTKNGTRTLKDDVRSEDLKFVINTASQYSPWSASTAGQGYITAMGGHRIGICGDCVVQQGSVSGIRTPTSLCIRIARDFPGIAADAVHYNTSVLIIGPPGSGKTTLLRDLIRQRSHFENVAVVDERCELFPLVHGASAFESGTSTDILTGCTKNAGITMLLRTMGPSTIAVDEITQEEDCKALISAAWSGVRLLATAHATSKEDLLCRPIYRPLIQRRLFDILLVLQPDKSWKAERATP